MIDLNSQHDLQLVEALMKSLAAGTPQAPGTGYPLIAESLDGTLKTTSNTMNDIVLYKMLPKGKAQSILEQYNLLTSYGADLDGFIAEGELPEEETGTYERRSVQIKYLAEMRRVKHPMVLVNNANGDAIAQETVAGTMSILRKMERSLWHGDSAVNPLAIDGIIAQIIANAPLNVIDWQGRPPTEDLLTDACRYAVDAPNYGHITHLGITPRAHADLEKLFFPRQKIDVMPAGAEGMVGIALNGFKASHGDVRFVPDKFLSPRIFAPLSATPVNEPARQPAAPVVTVNAAAGAPGGGVVSFFLAGDAGAYRYRASAVARSGQSASVAIAGSPVAVAAGQVVTFSLQEGVGGAPTVRFEIYRTPVNGLAGSEEKILSVLRPAGGGAVIVTDTNSWRPATTVMVGITMDPEVIKLLQLTPLMKVPFPPADLSIRWAQLIYYALRIAAPAKLFVIKNVGRATGAVI